MIGSGLVPVFGFILTWFAKAIRKNARDAALQTRREDWSSGQLVTVPVADIMHKVSNDTHELRNDTQEIRDEFRSEITDLVNDPRSTPLMRVHGRRRDTPTNPVPSLYTGMIDSTEKDPDA